MRNVVLLLTSFFTLSFGNYTKAQNLVKDGSFEDLWTCPQIMGAGFYSTLMQWRYSGTISGYTLNTCNTNNWGVPQNKFGYQNSHTGNGYICLGTLGSATVQPDFRQYAVGQLKQTLEQGKKYRVSMYVSLADSLIIACNNLSTYFSDTIPTYNFFDSYKIHFNFTHPVDVNFHQDLSNKVGWTKLDTTFIATGNERWLTLGNFLPDSLSDTNFVGGNSVPSGGVYWDGAGYYIDDVSITPIQEYSHDSCTSAHAITLNAFEWGNYKWSTGDTTASITAAQSDTYTLITSHDSLYRIDTFYVSLTNPDCFAGISPVIARNEAISVFPSPNNGSFSIQTKVFNKSNTFVITNELGEVVDSVILNSNNTVYENNNLSSGIYFYTTTSKGVVTSRGKFMVQR